MNGRRAPRCTRAYDPRLREAVGAYLLGGLEPAEADEMSAHLSECESCRADYAELADLVPLMAMVTEQEAVNGPVRPEPAVLGRVIASSRQQRAAHRAERTQRRAPQPRSRRTTLALAAACVVLAAGGSAIGMRMSTHSTVSTEWSASAIVLVPTYGTGGPTGEITALAAVVPNHSGSRINFSMEGVPKNYECWMVVKGTDGSVDRAGNWNSKNGGTVSFTADSSYSPDHISGIDINLRGGVNLLHITHP